MSNVVITISRQYGAAGREIATKVAEKLGVHLYDRQLVHIAAAQLQIDELSEEELLKLEREVPPLGLSFTPFFSFGMRGEKPLNQQIFEAEAGVIARLARNESCVILGRCADFVLHNERNVVSVFIHASDKFRADRGVHAYLGKTLEDLKREDEKRALYYKHFTAQEFGAPENYDLVVRADKGTTDEIADAIVAYAKAFVK
ncbi:MAG TPA: cytidylate kinase-like family protein [Candidatus Anaerobiospirillum stercoravium]|nr:cytidylate kinase-like family protein [Candidatus Anaerobiospirillum stercoravium]